MPTLRLVALGGLFLTVVSLSGCVTSGGGGGSAGGSSINDTARYLAGMPGSNRSDLAVPRNSAAWRAHQSRMDALWSQHSGRRSALRGFRGQIGGLSSPGVLFYPFGGPDYLHANALFPGARSYVLVGLEGVDSMPDLKTMSASDLSRGLGGIANSLRTVTGASYFITKEMRVDLQSTRFRGDAAFDSGNGSPQRTNRAIGQRRRHRWGRKSDLSLRRVGLSRLAYQSRWKKTFSTFAKTFQTAG